MSALLDMHRKLEISNGVLVQAACYQHDHSALLSAIALTAGRYRGVALIDGSESEVELQRLHDGGVRGIRFNFMGHLSNGLDMAQLRTIAERVDSFDWHVLLHGKLAQLVPILDMWRGLRTTLVIDHMGRADPCVESDLTSLNSLQCHLEDERRWVKLSGVDRMMSTSQLPWSQAVPLVRRLLAAAPDRAIWGSDWPHPNIQGDVPDDAQLLGFFEEACGDSALAEAVLVHNPQKLYS